MATPLPLCHRCKAADMINDNINPISQGAVPVKNVLLAIALVILLGDLANSQIDDSTPPPLNKERMVGEWEAITQLPYQPFSSTLSLGYTNRRSSSPSSLDRPARKFLSSYPRKSVMDMRSSVSGRLGTDQKKVMTFAMSGWRALHMAAATFRFFERKCGKMGS